MYTRQIGRDYWFDFDNQTLWQRTPEVGEAIVVAYEQQNLSLDTMADAFIGSWRGPGHPEPFRARVAGGATGITALVDIQLTILRAHLAANEDALLAFEDFGQGVLFDNRPPRPPGRHVHMMDGRPSNWVGYRRWLALLSAAEVLGYPDAQSLAHLKRCVLLAWAIQTEADPSQSSSANPGLPAERLQLLRQHWLALPAAVQDWAFATHRFRAPSITEFDNAGRFKAVQSILDTAATDGQPDHDGTGRFWNEPLAKFVETEVFGRRIIANPGANRGENSPLVKVLRGTLQGMPRMPMAPRPPLSPEQIAFISEWIDAGCPEF